MNKKIMPHGKKENSSIMESQIKKLNTIQDNQSVIWNEQRIGFVELGIRFAGLKQQNENLKAQNQELQEQIARLNQNIRILIEEANVLKQEREEKEVRKKARAKRKRLPKRDPMTASIYAELIKACEGPTYINLRLRIAFCILAVTGIRINELLPLKVFQLKTLVKDGWIAIDRCKKGPANHKAFLTAEGRKIIKNRNKDFQLLFLLKQPKSYIFTSEKNHNKMLTRETVTKDVNKIMREVSSQLENRPNITSHSFRIGYITDLWRDSRDIEFVRQTIGHRSLNSTSAYVTHMNDEERQNRILSIG